MNQLIIVIIAAIAFVTMACNTGDGGSTGSTGSNAPTVQNLGCVNGGVSDAEKISNGSRYCHDSIR